jgi:hypothetical protein
LRATGGRDATILRQGARPMSIMQSTSRSRKGTPGGLAVQCASQQEPSRGCAPSFRAQRASRHRRCVGRTHVSRGHRPRHGSGLGRCALAEPLRQPFGWRPSSADHARASRYPAGAPTVSAAGAFVPRRSAADPRPFVSGCARLRRHHARARASGPGTRPGPGARCLPAMRYRSVHRLRPLGRMVSTKPRCDPLRMSRGMGRARTFLPPRPQYGGQPAA